MSLFPQDLILPPGFSYTPDFISKEEESELLKIISLEKFTSFEMYGVEAKRKIIHYGMKYDFLSRTATRIEQSPSWLSELKRRCEDVLSKEISQMLVTHYPVGSAIGWHFDAPPFESLMGISLMNSCRFLLRKGTPGNWVKSEVELEARSAYVISGEARTRWEHHIPPVKAERYSITFRTLKS